VASIAACHVQLGEKYKISNFGKKLRGKMSNISIGLVVVKKLKKSERINPNKFIGG